MKNILLLFFLLCSVSLFAQFPNNPVKVRLGYQTTSKGLIYYGTGAPSSSPTGFRNDAFAYVDTTANTMYLYDESNDLWEFVTDSIYVSAVIADTATVLRAYADQAEQDAKDYADANDDAGLSESEVSDIVSDSITYYPTLSQFVNTSKTFALNTRVKIGQTGAEYLIQSNSVAGYVVDSVAVVPNGSNYAVLQPQNGSYNIEWFGAIPDTIIDSKAAVQKAIDYARIKGSLKVLIGEGMFALSDSLTIYQGSFIEGSSMRGSILYFNNDSKGITLSQITSYENLFKIKNLELRGSNNKDMSTYNGNHGISTYNARSDAGAIADKYGYTIESVFVNEFGGHGIALYDDFVGRVINVISTYNGGHSFFSTGGNSMHFESCHAIHTAPDYAGYRIFTAASLISCNGDNQNVWGHFGDDGTDPENTAGTSFFPSIYMLNCNLESYDSIGLVFEESISAYPNTITNSVFNATASVADTFHIYAPDGGSPGRMTINNSLFLGTPSSINGFVFSKTNVPIFNSCSDGTNNPYILYQTTGGETNLKASNVNTTLIRTSVNALNYNTAKFNDLNANSLIVGSDGFINTLPISNSAIIENQLYVGAASAGANLSNAIAGFSKSVNGDATVGILNTGLSTMSKSVFHLETAGSNISTLSQQGPFYATSLNGLLTQDGLALNAGGALSGGLSIGATSTTGDIRIYAGGVTPMKAKFPAQGGLNVGSGAFTSAVGVINAETGFRLGDDAPIGAVLEGDGTNFVVSTVTNPTGGTNTVQAIVDDLHLPDQINDLSVSSFLFDAPDYVIWQDSTSGTPYKMQVRELISKIEDIRSPTTYFTDVSGTLDLDSVLALYDGAEELLLTISITGSATSNTTVQLPNASSVNVGKSFKIKVLDDSGTYDVIFDCTNSNTIADGNTLVDTITATAGNSFNWELVYSGRDGFYIWTNF